MASYERGASGAEIRQIQAQLQAAGLYLGPLDGQFGGGTESAVRRFQAGAGLAVDGVVGAETWRALFQGTAVAAAMPPPAMAAQPLEYRCLALTGSFETGSGPPDCFARLSGDFDGEGLSFGALQWNLGQGSLQPLLRDFIAGQPALYAAIFGDHCAEFDAVLAQPISEQVAWGSSITFARGNVIEPWRGLFKTPGRQPGFQDIESRYAKAVYGRALGLCREFGLTVERGVALMFDIVTQNGGIPVPVKVRISQDVAALDPALPSQEREVAIMQIVANRRADAAKPAWADDVRQRKLAIANGAGVVHGKRYDLLNQYGIGLARA